MWVAKAQAAVVDSKVAAYLPTVDGAAMAARLLGDAALTEEDDE